MKFSKIIMLALVFSVATTTYLNAQNQKASQTVQYDFLKGLTKANEDDMSDQQIMLDGESIPVYSADGKRVRGMEMMQLMTSSGISPDFYLYAEKEIRAIIFAMNKKPKIESFLNKHTFDYTILPDSGTVIGDYKIENYPAHIILDQNSKIAFSIRGLSNSTASEIDDAIEGLIEK